MVRSVVRGRKIDSIDKGTCCEISHGFKLFSHHDDGLFGVEEMELTHCRSSFTTALACLNDDTSKLSTFPPNLEHHLGIDNNDIANPMSLSNTLI